jgi:hypothetical protein
MKEGGGGHHMKGGHVEDKMAEARTPQWEGGNVEDKVADDWTPLWHKTNACTMLSPIEG